MVEVVVRVFMKRAGRVGIRHYFAISVCDGFLFLQTFSINCPWVWGSL